MCRSLRKLAFIKAMVNVPVSGNTSIRERPALATRVLKNTAYAETCDNLQNPLSSSTDGGCRPLLRLLSNGPAPSIRLVLHEPNQTRPVRTRSNLFNGKQFKIPDSLDSCFCRWWLSPRPDFARCGACGMWRRFESRKRRCRVHGHLQWQHRYIPGRRRVGSPVASDKCGR